jgi:predicted nucleic acid-binding protein
MIAKVVLDASVLVNFLAVDRVDLLNDLVGHHFYVVTAHAFSEVTCAHQRARLRTVIQAGELKELNSCELAELATFARLTATLGAGESASIAIALHRSMVVALEDPTARRTAESLLGKNNVVGTVDLFRLAICAGLLSVADAELIRSDWQSKVAIASELELALGMIFCSTPHPRFA